MHPNQEPVEEVVQRQLHAYNARSLQAFMACYAEDVECFSPPQAEPVLSGRAALSAHYAANHFHLPALRAELVNRMVLGNKVVDHERVTGVRDAPFEAAVVYEVQDGLIRRVWFFNQD
jgi:hypothetical protein